jgi:Tfp pilus assembly protein PilP
MRTFGLSLIVWSCAVVGGAQTPAKPAQPVQAVQAVPPPPAVGASPAQPPAKPAPPPPQESFAYESGGRDPFVNILATGSEPRQASGRRGEGAAGLIVAEISVSGIVQHQGSLVAMVQGPDKKTYLVHQGDKFLDGTVKTITPQGLIIVQEVKDPLSLVKQREIRKQLRSLEDAKQ